MNAEKKSLGNWGEALAAEYLTQRGYIVLERNVQTPYGEIDLIVQQPDFDGSDRTQSKSGALTLVFVEVKTRTSSSFGYPEEAVTVGKQEHLLAAAQHYLQQHPEFEGCWRMDVIAIRRLPKMGKIEIRHFENAFH